LPPAAAPCAGANLVGGPRPAAKRAYLFQDSVKKVEDGTFSVAQSADNSQKTQE
jgi:hypothetical protein